MKRVTIVQPYVPEYRVPFFEGLGASLAADDIECTIAAGHPDAAQGERGDSAERPWIQRVPERRISLGGRSITLGNSRRSWVDADAVIVGHVGSALDTYRALLHGRRSRLRVGVWGHIRSYVNDPNPLDAAVERWQLRRADHVFAYTPGGAAYAEQVGVDPARITTVMNTTSTEQLREACDAMSPSAVAAFRAAHGIDGLPTLAYIGGLDESKRIDFLAAALDAMWSLDATVRVLVAGKGRQSFLLEEAEARGQVVRVGFADLHLKALIGLSSSALLNPGRIGLTAVEALALGRPLLTTTWAYHAPEAEYLVEGTSRLTTRDDPGTYAEVAVRLSQNRVPPQEWPYPRLDEMIGNFASGIRQLLDGPH